MTSIRRATLATLCLFFTVSPSFADAPPKALNFKMKAIDGKEVSLKKYAGKVVVLVNVASDCGSTPQYKSLQALHEKYADKGLAIVGVPCNQFGKQEPGSNKEIQSFCTKNYGVEFDMLAKVDVNGSKQCDLYGYLSSVDTEPEGKGPVKWNFEKYVLDRTGKPIGRFGSSVEPDSREFVKLLEKELAKTAPAVAPYSHKSKKSGKTYYLFTKDVPLRNSDKVQTIYWFAAKSTSEKGQPLSEVPEGKMVSETKTGLLVLKNKPPKK